MYRIREVAPEVANKPARINGKTISGRVLMNEGIVLPELTKTQNKTEAISDVRPVNDYRSLILEFTEVK